MPEKAKKRHLGGWVFLILVLIAYGFVGLIDPDAAMEALAFFMHVMKQVLPVLGVVFFLLFIANLVLTPKRIKRYLGQEAGLKGWMTAVGSGVLSVGPIYAWYVVLGELKDKGMRTALIATFLYSRSVKLPLLPLMIHYFGIIYTLVLCLYLLIFAVINGMLVEKMLEQKI